MKAVKYTLNNDKVRYLMSTDNQLNMLIKYIENTDYIYYNISMIWPIVAVGALVGITNIPEYSGYPQLQPQPNY